MDLHKTQVRNDFITTTLGSRQQSVIGKRAAHDAEGVRRKRAYIIHALPC